MQALQTLLNHETPKYIIEHEISYCPINNSYQVRVLFVNPSSTDDVDNIDEIIQVIYDTALATSLNLRNKIEIELSTHTIPLDDLMHTYIIEHFHDKTLRIEHYNASTEKTRVEFINCK